MTRQQAAANARATLALKRKDRGALEQEIRNLRNQIGAELGKMYGASGLHVTLGTIDEEYVPELKTHSGRSQIFERMANDPIVRGQLRAISSTLISGVRWKVEGGPSELRDLIAANLLRQGPRRFWCSTSWADRLYESLGMLWYGFSLFAKTRAIVDGKYIFSDLKWLHPRSVRDQRGWPMDENDNLLAVRRLYTDANGYTHYDEIPASEVFIVPWDRRGPNWEGNAFIRPMYKPWKLRELAEKINIIDLQNRGVGIPVAHLSGQGGPKERDTLVEILKSLRGGSKERAFIVLEKDEKVDFLTTTGTVRDAQTTLDTHRADIAKATGSEGYEAGNTSSGSRAASSAMMSGFFIQVDAIAAHLQDIFNHGAGNQMGLVEEIAILNGYEDEDELPEITRSRVSPTEQLDNVPLIGDLVQKGAVPRSYKLTNWLMDRLGGPELSQKEYDESVGARAVVDIAGEPGPTHPTLIPPVPPGDKAAAGNNGGAGRPASSPDSTKPQDPRADAASRRFGLQSAQKKTPDGSPRTRRSVSWPWLESTAS